jgi:ankyrin repeat protein
VKQIESGDVDLNAPNDEGDAPIHAIVRHKRKKRADLLLSLLVNGCSRVDVYKQMFKVIWRHCSTLGCHGRRGDAGEDLAHIRG